MSFSVGTDQPISYPSNLTSWPDEHVTFFPSPAANGFLVFGSSAVTGGMGGAVALQSQNLQTFNLATGLGYSEQVIDPPVAFGSCNPSYNAEFDENYTGPGTVVQDPTLPPGNLIMIYEAQITAQAVLMCLIITPPPTRRAPRTTAKPGHNRWTMC